MPIDDENTTNTENTEPSGDNTVSEKPPVQINGFVKHQSEYNIFSNGYSQKTGFGLNVKDGKNSYSGAIYALNPQKFQIEGIYSRSLFNTNIKENPQDTFGVSLAYRNQCNFSTDGVKDSNRISVEESYNHKFDNGWKIGVYANENAKLNFSALEASTSLGYIAGVSFGKGKVSGYFENQGDLKLAKNPTFTPYINAGLKVTF